MKPRSPLSGVHEEEIHRLEGSIQVEASPISSEPDEITCQILRYGELLDLRIRGIQESLEPRDGRIIAPESTGGAGSSFTADDAAIHG